MLRQSSLAALTFLAALGVARADVYRWIDEKGEAHYSDQWVPGSTVIKTDKMRPGSAAAARAEDKALSTDVKNINGQLAAQDNARAMQQDKAAKQKEQCKEAQDRYMKAIEARRIYKPGKDGERDFLSDPEADAYRASMRKDVADLCGSVPVFNPETPLKPQPQPIPEPKVNPALATSE